MRRLAQRLLEQLTSNMKRLIHWSGLLAAATVFIAIIFTALSAFATKFGFGSNALIELQWYCFSLIFLSAGAWTLAHDEHVRVDVLARRFSPRTRLYIDLLGHLFFLLPLCLLLIYLGTQETLMLLHSGERSADAGGLIRWPVKALIPFGFILLLCQLLLQIAHLLPAALAKPVPTTDHAIHD